MLTSFTVTTVAALAPLDVDVPDPPPQAPPGLDQKMETLLAWGKWGVLICGVAGLFICAGQMAIGRKCRRTPWCAEVSTDKRAELVGGQPVAETWVSTAARRFLSR
ncbi:hypothetical protein [Actinomadura sp. BRA 177]|uniref:hypothetical protein n=1 Tax=Actinomadura sp. BRA 177 TaxID=2745202 RepID=UPI00159595B7|nr:hypothetical protein [Actinomadura sp. BRA 177]NVI86819.1 hypothetical protein [Actinomadura sp. BRA 177]